jgi:hypothetical protein
VISIAPSITLLYRGVSRNSLRIGCFQGCDPIVRQVPCILHCCLSSPPLHLLYYIVTKGISPVARNMKVQEGGFIILRALQVKRVITIATYYTKQLCREIKRTWRDKWTSYSHWLLLLLTHGTWKTLDEAYSLWSGYLNQHFTHIFWRWQSIHWNSTAPPVILSSSSPASQAKNV